MGMTTTPSEQDHWSERGRATSVANADAVGRPRRSIRSLNGNSPDCRRLANDNWEETKGE